MTLQELLKNYEILSKMDLTEGSIKFKFALVKNIKLIEEEVNKNRETLQEVIKPNEKLTEFETKRIELLKEYSEKDENGNPKQDKMGNAVIDENRREEFNKKMEELLEEYKDIIEERNKQMQEYNELLNSEIDLKELNLRKISLDLIPDSLSMSTLKILEDFEMIDE